MKKVMHGLIVSATLVGGSVSAALLPQAVAGGGAVLVLAPLLVGDVETLAVLARRPGAPAAARGEEGEHRGVAEQRAQRAIEVELQQLYVTVTHHGEWVNDLDVTDFQVADQGDQQRVDAGGAHTELPHAAVVPALVPFGPGRDLRLRVEDVRRAQREIPPR